MAGTVISEAPVTQWKQQIKRLSESHAWQEATKLLLDLRAEKLEVDGEIFGAIIHAGTSAQAWNVALRSLLEMTEVDLVTGWFCKASNILKVDWPKGILYLVPSASFNTFYCNINNAYYIFYPKELRLGSQCEDIGVGFVIVFSHFFHWFCVVPQVLCLLPSSGPRVLQTLWSSSPSWWWWCCRSTRRDPEATPGPNK